MRGILLALIMIMGCQARKETYENEASKPVSKEPSLSYQEEGYDSLPLASNFTDLPLAGARNIGEFFDHRLVFYKVNRPGINICGSKVNALVLYFIDSTLVRLRYEVDRNVSNQLLDSLGLSRFKPLDSLSKHLLGKRKVYNKIKRQLDSRLSNYELVWRKGNAVTRFRVTNGTVDSLGHFLFYTEMKGYKRKARELETHYNYLEATLPG